MGVVPADPRYSPAGPASDAAPAPDGDQSDLFRIALANVPHGLCMFDASKRLMLCNAAYAEMYGLPERLREAGTPLQAILDHRARAGNGPADLDTYFDVIPMAHSSGRYAGTRVRLKDGRTIQITHNPMADGGYVAVHEDVTTHVDAEDRLKYLAGHDQLTGLCNRHAFGERLSSVLSESRPGAEIAMHCLDLDRFKAVNDAFGHHVGDMLLQRVAERLSRCGSPREVVGRLGGDEFIVVQPDVGGEDAARNMAHRVIEAVARPYRLNGHKVSIGVSIGIAMHPAHGSTPDDLLKKADRALYEAKAGGGNVSRMYHATETPWSRSRTSGSLARAGY